MTGNEFILLCKDISIVSCYLHADAHACPEHGAGTRLNSVTRVCVRVGADTPRRVCMYAFERERGKKLASRSRQ